MQSLCCLLEAAVVFSSILFFTTVTGLPSTPHLRKPGSNSTEQWSYTVEERHDLLHGAGSINTLGASTSHTTPAAVDMEEEEEEAVKKEEERWVGSGEWRDAFKCDGGSSSRSLERGGLDWTRDRATVAELSLYVPLYGGRCLPAADAHLPAADAHLPAADAHLPAADTHLPAADTHLPAADIHLPAADTHLPAADTHLPAADIHLPAADTHMRLPPPTNLQMEHVSLTTVHLSWDYDDTTTPTNMQATSITFLVQCKRDQNKFAFASNALNSTEFTFDLLCPAVKYQFRILACHAGTLSQPSEPTYAFWNGVTAPAGPPTHVGVAVLSPRSVRLTWDPPSSHPLGGVVYYIHWGEDPGHLNKTQVISVRTQCILISLLPAHTYFFQLVADVSSHTSSPSPLLSVTLPPDLPPVTISTTPSLSFSWINLKWSPPPNNRYPTAVDNFTVLYADLKMVPFSDIGNYSLYLFFIASNSSLEANVTDLISGTEYTFRVFYYSEGIYSSDWSVAEVFRTFDTLLCTECKAITSTSMRVTWETSLTRGNVQQPVAIFERTCDGQLQEIWTLLSSVVRDSYIISDLCPWTEYAFTVAIGNSSSPTYLVSDCPTDSCITMEDAPSEPPLNFALAASTSRTVTLEWDTPPPGAQNGIVTQYFLTYTCTTPTSWLNCNLTVPRVIPASAQHENVLVENLIPYTEYQFQIAAETSAGKGPAMSLLCITAQDVPSQSPRHVTVQSISATGARLYWEPPEPGHRNGPIVSYSVTYGAIIGPSSLTWKESDERSVVVVSLPEVNLNQLTPETHYIVSVAAMTEVGEGPYSLPLPFQTNRSDIYTQLGDNDGFTILTEHAVASKNDCVSMSINWNRTVSSLGDDLWTNDSLASANYSLLFWYLPSGERWSVQLNPASLSYQLPLHTLANDGNLWLHLHITVLLPNRSHLHLTSTPLQMPALNCTEGSEWEIVVGVTLTCVVAVSSGGLLFVCLLWCCIRRRNAVTTTATDILTDTYRTEQGIEELGQRSSTLQVGDGAVVERTDESPMNSPTQSPTWSMAVSLADNSSLGSLMDEDTLLLGPEENCDRETRSVLSGAMHSGGLLQCHLHSTTSLQGRSSPLPFPPPPLSRPSPEGQSLSSSTSTSSPDTPADPLPPPLSLPLPQ